MDRDQLAASLMVVETAASGRAGRGGARGSLAASLARPRSWGRTTRPQTTGRIVEAPRSRFGEGRLAVEVDQQASGSRRTGPPGSRPLTSCRLRPYRLTITMSRDTATLCADSSNVSPSDRTSAVISATPQRGGRPSVGVGTTGWVHRVRARSHHTIGGSGIAGGWETSTERRGRRPGLASQLPGRLTRSGSSNTRVARIRHFGGSRSETRPPNAHATRRQRTRSSRESHGSARLVEPPWRVEPLTYALRVLRSPVAECSPSTSVHIPVVTVHSHDHRRTSLEATKEATRRSSAAESASK